MAATVVPHARAPESGEPLPLEDLVAPYLAQGFVAVTGAMGTGKSTACRYLAERFPDARFVDEPAADAFETVGQFTYFARERRRAKHVAHFVLAPWTTDQVLEYLLAAHREQCGSVMTRLRRAPDADLPGGVPELWTAALDAMARDESIPDVATALRAIYAPDRKRAGSIALACTRGGRVPRRQREQVRDSGWGSRARRLICHRPVQASLAAAAIADRVGRDEGFGYLRRVPPPDVLRLAGPTIVADARARFALARLLDTPEREPAAASLLHAAGVSFRPRPGAKLEYAHLRGVHSTCARRATPSSRSATSASAARSS